MNKIAIIFVTILSFEAFANRTQLDTEITTIRTEEDAVLENKASCVNFLTKETNYDSADIAYENNECYMRYDHSKRIKIIFLEQMQSYFSDKIVLWPTAFNSQISAQDFYINYVHLDHIMNETLKKISETEGCRATLNVASWGSKTLLMLNNSSHIGSLVNMAAKPIRCK
jgi:hypothetical protein